MKGLHIFGILMAVALFFLSLFYIVECIQAMWTYNGSGLSLFGPSRADLTIEAGLISLVFTLFHGTQSFFHLRKIKTSGAKVMSIIGLSFSGLLLLFNFLILAQPAHSSYDEAGPAWTLFSLVMIAFSIVFLIQTNGYDQKNKPLSNPEVIDDFDEIV